MSSGIDISVSPVQQQRHHGMQTKLQTGAISTKNYATYLTTLPELSSLQLFDSNSVDSCPSEFAGTVYRGFSFLADITEVEEPKTFKVASSKVEWKLAMQEEYDALKTQGT